VKEKRECSEDGCHIDISHKGNRAKRCDDHQAAFHASRERDRYSRVKDKISTHRILRRQGAEEYEGPHEDDVIDYTRGDPQPGLRPLTGYRSPSRHDTARRVQEDHARRLADAEPDQASWDEVVNRQPDRRVAFPPAPGSSALAGGFRGRGEVPEITDWASAGQFYRPSPAAGQRALQAHTSDRFGGRVEYPPAIHSGQLESNAPHLQAREAVQAAQVRQASEHSRSLGWTRR
jgi:hypothetical protein